MPLLSWVKTDIVESATGDICAHLPAYRQLVVLSDVQQVVAIDEADEIGLIRWDLITGEPLGRQALPYLPSEELVERIFPLPARGEFLVFCYDHWSRTILDRYLSRLPVADDSMSEMPHPDTINENAGGERVLGRD